MAVGANTNETYDSNLIREDLQEAYAMISPEEVPFQSSASTKPCSNTLFEWPVVELAAADNANRVIEGDDAPAVDTPNNGLRMSNYTQISDKNVSVSHTADAVDGAANNIQKLKEQVALKLRELKRDVEIMLLDNVPAVPASSGTARQTAGLPAFLKTNTQRVAGGADPTLSGTTEGYPDAAATAGTVPLTIAEATFNANIEEVWNEGGNPTLALVNGGNKRVISSTFTGSATRYKDAIDKTLSAAIDIYISDFNELAIVPTRFMRTNNPAGSNNSYNVFILDPDFYRIRELESTKQKPLAQTGHSRKRLIWREYGLQVDNEKAHGVYADTTNA